jgi:DNA-binding transcriptional regulator of glucitol operon
MSETLIIAVLAIAVVYLLLMARTQSKKYRDVKRRIKDRAWHHRDE